MKKAPLNFPAQRVRIEDFAEQIEDTEGHRAGDDLDPDKFSLQVESQVEFLEPHWSRR